MVKEPRWQQEQSRRKKHKTLKIVHYFLVAIFLILFLGISWRIYGAIKGSIWNGENRLTLVLNTDPISLASFDSHSQTISFLTIPNGTYIETAGEYGPYRIEKIYHLGEIERKGNILLSASLETYFGLPIDGWIIKNIKLQEKKEKEFLSELITESIRNKSLTNLSRWDLVRLWFLIKRTRAHKIEVVDLGKTSFAEEFNLPDGSQARKIDQERISQIINRLFSDYKIRDEDLAIAIMNAGSKAGLAAKAARLVANIGGRLVEVGDWQEKLEKCEIKTVPEYYKSYSCQKLARVFKCQCKKDLEKGARWDLLIILTESSWW